MLCGGTPATTPTSLQGCRRVCLHNAGVQKPGEWSYAGAVFVEVSVKSQRLVQGVVLGS